MTKNDQIEFEIENQPDPNQKNSPQNIFNYVSRTLRAPFPVNNLKSSVPLKVGHFKSFSNFSGFLVLMNIKIVLPGWRTF